MAAAISIALSSGYVLSLTPALHGRSKHFCGLQDSPLNNHKKCIRRLFIIPNNVWFTAGSFHFIKRPQFLSMSFQLCSHFGPFKNLYGDSCFSQNGLSMLE